MNRRARDASHVFHTRPDDAHRLLLARANVDQMMSHTLRWWMMIDFFKALNCCKNDKIDDVADGSALPRLGASNSEFSRAVGDTQPDHRQGDLVQHLLTGLDRTGPATNVTMDRLRSAEFDPRLPQNLYRAHVGTRDEVEENGIARPVEADVPASTDEQLAAILRHTAGTSGSGGHVQSLSANLATAARFMRGNTVMTRTDTRGREADFRSAGNIVLLDGERLVRQGLISPSILGGALRNLIDERGQEFFHVRGDIPPAAVTVLNPRTQSARPSSDRAIPDDQANGRSVRSGVRHSSSPGRGVAPSGLEYSASSVSVSLDAATPAGSAVSRSRLRIDPTVVGSSVRSPLPPPGWTRSASPAKGAAPGRHPPGVAWCSTAPRDVEAGHEIAVRL